MRTSSMPFTSLFLPLFVFAQVEKQCVKDLPELNICINAIVPSDPVLVDPFRCDLGHGHHLHVIGDVALVPLEGIITDRDS